MRAFLDFSTSATELKGKTKILESLQAFTQGAAKQYPNIAALRAELVYGADDHCVFIGKYDDDVRFPNREGHGHWSICKPTRDFIFPLKFVLGQYTEDRLEAKGTTGGPSE